jgi:spermidine synthase
VSVIELVGSVRDAFGFYFDDAQSLMQDPRGQVVIDDGRRFLQRTSTRYDLLTVDPPPHLEGAGSSLLYSKEFLKIVRQRFKPEGIVHHWLPVSSRSVRRLVHAVSRIIAESFSHVRAFASIEGWGIHYLASMEHIELPVLDELMARMPTEARRDLEEWVWQDEDDARSFVRRMFEVEPRRARPCRRRSNAVDHGRQALQQVLPVTTLAGLVL